jgi:hypothetical protein
LRVGREAPIDQPLIWALAQTLLDLLNHG